MNRDWKNELFKQKNLFQIFLISSRFFPRNSGNTRVIAGVVLVTVLAQLVAYLLPNHVYDIDHTADFVHSVSDVSLVFSLSVLGFLIAGFSIFASITKVDLFITLASIPYKRNETETGLNRLQFIFFNFMNVFSVYFILLAMALFVRLGYSEGSPLSIFGSFLASEYPNACMVVNIIASSVFLIILTEALLRLKSFIWNLYQSVLLVIVTSDEIAKNKNQEAQS